MSWNYRVIRNCKNGEKWHDIREVYYDVQDRPTMTTTTPCHPLGETLEELQSDLTHMCKALELPVLDSTIFDR